SNLQDVGVDEDKLRKVTVIPVNSIEEVLENALDWSGNEKLRDLMINGSKKRKQ
ncbi:hypothetical protein HZC32_03525, partial [Candidatus Woesearchaeota archaeon]|nr:hypothetical protein [Candidatus Woesearchaeota archaeon]